MNPIVGTSQASEIQMDYMKLLVTQLQNQNPLEPMNNQQMAAQLAQFSQLEQLENMNNNTNEMSSNIAAMNSTMEKLNASFQGSLMMAEYDYAKSLLGKEVFFYNSDYEQELSGKVEKVLIDPQSGASMLRVSVHQADDSEGTIPENLTVKLIDITGIKDSI